MNTEYFSRVDVKKQTGVSDTTLDRWTKVLYNTDMIKEKNGAKLYSEDFVTFINARMGMQGPSNPPDADVIANVCKLYRECSQHIPSVSDSMGENKMIVLAHLMTIGLEYTDTTEKQVWSRLSKKEFDRLDEYAKQSGLTRSAAIRLLVNHGLEEFELITG